MEETQIVPVEQSKEIEPSIKVEFARKVAKLLKDIIDQRPKKVIINGKQYIDFEAYQTIASFYGYSVGTEWTMPIVVSDNIIGYSAKANVFNKEGRLVSSAESSCTKDEDNWKNKPDFQVRSMAQTRACVKALRNVFAWVVVLAGYEPSPAEEMVEEKPQGFKNGKETKNVCGRCGKEIKSPAVLTKSVERFGVPLCFPDCQNAEEKERREKKKVDAEFHVCGSSEQEEVI